jgi:hypothetical protein
MTFEKYTFNVILHSLSNARGFGWTEDSVPSVWDPHFWWLDNYNVNIQQADGSKKNGEMIKKA